MSETVGNIQWKGTDVCMDLHCKCGCSSHIDGYFAFHIECPECNAVYKLHTEVNLSEATGNDFNIEPIIGEL